MTETNQSEIDNAINPSNHTRQNISQENIICNGLTFRKFLSSFAIKNRKDRGEFDRYYPVTKNKNLKVKVTLPTKRLTLMINDHNSFTIMGQYKLNQTHETEFRKKLLNLSDLMENETDISADRETIIITCTLENYCDLINCHNMKNVYHGNAEFYKVAIYTFPFVVVKEES